MTSSDVITKLFSLQDLNYRELHSRSCPGLTQIIGVRIPDLRKLAKEILQEDYLEFLHTVTSTYYEETLVEGLVICGAKIPIAEKLQLLQAYVPKINNWATNDTVCASLKPKSNELAQVWDFILQYQNSDKEYERRFMIVMMMDYFLLPAYLPQIFQILNNIKTEQYYVNMATAWLIATSFAKLRTETLTFLQKNNLDNWVQNKAIQKIRESYRVSDADKEMLLQYKR